MSRYGEPMSAAVPDPQSRREVVSDDRTPAQVAHERAMTEVSETLMNVEQAIRRTERAKSEVAKIGYEGGARDALDAVLDDLIKARDLLFQASYLVPVPGDEEPVEPEPTTLFPDLLTPPEPLRTQTA